LKSNILFSGVETDSTGVKYVKKQLILVIGVLLLGFIFLGASSAANLADPTADDKTAFKSVKNAKASPANIYVNVNTGNDGWDGTSPTYTSGTIGPKKTIKSGISVSNSGGNLNIASGTYKEHQLDVKVSLNILGQAQSNTIVDATQSNYIFHIYSGYTVTMSNLTFQNGKQSSGDDGGGIYNEGTLTLNSCIIQNNAAGNGSSGESGGDGGAIYNKGSLNLANCTLNNNNSGNGHDATPSDYGKSGGNGGAIYNEGTCTLQTCDLHNNHTGSGGEASGIKHGSSGGNGGAIYSTGTLTMNGCTFETNYTGKGGDSHESQSGGNGGYGGALYFTGTKLTITNCTYDSNYAGNGGNASGIEDAKDGGYGGTIYNNGPATMSTSEIKNSHAGTGGSSDESMDAGDGGHGGAIYNTNSLMLSDCTIQKNIAGKGGKGTGELSDAGNAGNGGGIYNTNSLTLDNCQFSDNFSGQGGTSKSDSARAGGDGGALYNTGTMKISGCEIYGNHASGGVIQRHLVGAVGGNGGNGGAIYNSGTANIDTSNIYQNKAGRPGDKSATGGSGGAIYNSGTLSVTQCVMYRNNAGTLGKVNSKNGLGGTLYSNSTKNTVVQFCQIINSRPQTVYLKTASSSTVKLQNNWWGSNTEPKDKITGTASTTSYYTPWLELSISANPSNVNINENSTVTADLITNSNNENTYQKYNMYVPNGIKIIFAAKSGTVKPGLSSTLKGASNTTFTAGSTTGRAMVFAHLDNQNVYATIKIGTSAMIVSKSIDKSHIHVGDTFIISVKLSNIGQDNAKGVVIKIPIHHAFQFISASFNNGTWSYNKSTRNLIWKIKEAKLGDHYLYITLKATKEGHFLLNNSITSETYNPNQNIPSNPLNIYVEGPDTHHQSVNAASNTVGMQNTGAPVAILVLAILIVLGGLSGFKRK
jgi:uncharacterized repeat protein (TIGR01451 family)